MLTASHNPPAYNGIKLCLPGARPIGRDSGLGEMPVVAITAFGDAPGDGGAAAVVGDDDRVEHLDLLDEFAAHVRSFVDVASLQAAEGVADTANGMGGLIAPAGLRRPAFRARDPLRRAGRLISEPSGRPDPGRRTSPTCGLGSSSDHADVGLAFDGDADRVFLVDEKAEPLSGSLTTAIVAATMLERHPGSKILYNLICSHAVPEIIIEQGGIPIRTRVGHSFIKAVMAETGAIFGGEHSGHYYFRDNYRADSGIIAALVVLEAALQGRGPALGAQAAVRALLGLRRDQHRGARPGRGDRQGGRALQSGGRRDRRPRRHHCPGWATGGSTCARRTPSRC